MNLNRIVTIGIIVLFITGMLFSAQTVSTVAGKRLESNTNYIKEIELGTETLSRVDDKLESILNNLNSEPDRATADEIEAELYDIARSAHKLARRTALHLGIDESRNLPPSDVENGLLNNMDIFRATKGDVLKMRSVGNDIAKVDSNLKDILQEWGTYESRNDEEFSGELTDIYLEAVSIQDEALSHLDMVNFPYGNMFGCGRDHAPILINGNSDFTAANGVTGGSGTPADPYIISGWKINAATAEGIDIWNTNAHFIIKNVCVHSGSVGWDGNDGIFFRNVKNGAIETSSIYNNYIGIYIFDSADIRIEGCLINGNYNKGILIRNSPDTVIEDNSFTLNGNYGAIHLLLSDDCTITDNNIERNGGNGIFLDECKDASVSFNIVTKNTRSGIGCGRSTHVTISNNNASRNGGNGISFFDSIDIIVKNNEVAMNFENGIGVGVDNFGIEITGNTIIKNGGSTLEGAGITTVLSSYIDIVNNYIENNLGTGIKIGVSNSKIDIIGNIITNNSGSMGFVGISVVASWNILIKCNNITDHPPFSATPGLIDMNGVFLNRHTSDVTVVHNNFIKNGNQGYDNAKSNSWDSGYPGGGNYWSDKSGDDLMSGPNQDIPGSDGIYDTPHSFNYFNANNKDYYPLVEPADIEECMEPWVETMQVASVDTKISKISKILGKSEERFTGTLTRLFDLNLAAETALRSMGEEANVIVVRITLVLNDDYPCQMITLPDVDRDGSDNGNSKCSRESTANRLEADTKKIIRVDQSLMGVLTNMGPRLDEDTEDALKAMREEANGIVVSINQQIGS
jgi:parallel beta-helix repeat protein